MGGATPGIAFGGTQLSTPASSGSVGQRLSLTSATSGTLSFSDPESPGLILRRKAAEAPAINPYNKPYMHACEPWQPSTLYYNQKAVVHGGNLYLQVGSAGTTSTTGPNAATAAGITDGGCVWIQYGPNLVTNDPGQTLITWTTSLAVTAGQLLNVSNARIYAVTSAGTTSGTTAPTSTSIGITDGSATLSYYGPYKPVPTIADWPTVTKVSSVSSLTNIYSPTAYPTAVGASSAQVIAGGSGYAVNDTITLNTTGGTGSATVLTVTSVSSGAVTAASVTTAGSFTVLPTLNPVTQASTSGSGTSATFVLKYPDPWWCKYRGCYNAGATSASRSFTYVFQPKANTTPLSSHCAIEFWSNADVLAIVTSNAAPHYQVYIDGVRWNFDGLSADTAAAWFHNFDFTATGGAKIRKWRIEGITNLDFRGVRVGPTRQVWAPDDTDKVTAVVISDSIVAGSGYSPFLNGNSWAHALGWELGWSDVYSAAQGGTGYLTAGSGSIFRYRVTEAASLSPQAWVIWGSTNDSGNTTAALQTEVSATLTAIRALSTAPIFVGGILPVDDSAYASGKKIADYETAIAAAVTAAADPTIFFISMRNDTVPWITGSWNNSGLSTSSNASDLINGNDNIHPPDKGVTYHARRFANAIRSKITSMK